MYILWEFYKHEGWEPTKFEDYVEMQKYINRLNKPSNFIDYLETRELLTKYHDVKEYYQD